MTAPNNNPPNDPQSGDGLSALDISGLPPAQLKIMRILLREVELNYAALCNAIDALPEAERLSRAELNHELAQLIDRKWLTNIDGLYRANLRRKATRILSEFVPPRRKSTTLKGIWDSLETPKPPDDKDKK